MADMAEYYHQISEIQKAVREREIHRLELEKQRLMKTHRKEKRYEELRDRIKELHRELVHEELKATHRFQNLLSQVDAVKREHQLLAAHTERLRQKKHQYEMQMAKANPGFHYTVQDGQYQNFPSSVGAATRIVPQAASPQDINFPKAQPVIYPQSHMSLLNSSLSTSSNHWHVQPPGNPLHPEQISPHEYGLQSLNVAGTPPAFIGQQGTSIFFTNPQTNGGTNSFVSLPQTIGATQFTEPSVQFTDARNLKSQTNLVSASLGHTQSKAGRSIPYVQNSPITSDSITYNQVTHPQHAQALYAPISEGQPSREITLGTHEVNSQQNMLHHNLATKKSQSHSQLQESQYIESLQKPISSIQNIQMGIVSNHTQLPNKQILSSSHATYDLPTTPANTVIHRAPEPAEISGPMSFQSSSNIYQVNMHSNDSFSQTTPSVSRLPEPTSGESLMKKTTIPHPSTTEISNESAHNGALVKEKSEEMIQLPKEHSEQDQLLDANCNQVGSTVEHNTPDALNNQLSVQYDNFSPMPTNLDIGKQKAEKRETNPNSVCENRRKVKEEKGSIHKDTEASVHLNSQIRFQEVDYINKKLASDEGQSSESTPAVNDISKSPTQHVDHNFSKASISTANASPDKEIGHDSNPISKISSNDSIATSPQAKHGDTNLTVSMDHTLKESRVDTMQSLGIHPEETNHPNRKDETGMLSHRSVISQSDTLVTKSLKKVNEHPSSSAHGRSDFSKTSLAGSKALIASQSKFQSQDIDEDNDSDFFDHNAPVAASTAYKSLVGDASVIVETSLDTESESDDVEGQISTILSKQETQIRSIFKPFASSIPSLQPPPPGTDSDSVDSVEATIQAALKNNKEHPSMFDSGANIQEPQESPALKATPSKANSLLPKENRKTGVGDVESKPRPSTALQLNLESDSESYGVSAGGEASDEDDFDFYDKF